MILGDIYYMTHEYDFDCDCWLCSDITRFFNLRSKDEARKLGYDLTP